MSEKSSADLSRGWNDPPTYIPTTNESRKSDPAATRRRLNKRVPIPIRGVPVCSTVAGQPPPSRDAVAPLSVPPPAAASFSHVSTESDKGDESKLTNCLSREPRNADRPASDHLSNVSNCSS